MHVIFWFNLLRSTLPEQMPCPSHTRMQFPSTIKTLWPSTVDFIYENKRLINERTCIRAMVPRVELADGREDALVTRYDSCHFWSNFEIGRWVLCFLENRERICFAVVEQVVGINCHPSGCRSSAVKRIKRTSGTWIRPTVSSWKGAKIGCDNSGYVGPFSQCWA